MAKSVALFLTLLFASFSSWGQLNNQLAHHPSPYLALHGADPVHWQNWGQAVIDEAHRENKLIFISSGYFACHWCHVMQRESYKNPDIAAFLNQHFIPVKIDRELEPALDAHLIDFVQRTRGHAGWPLNVFLTPDGYPVVGLTYARPNEFGGLLQRLTQVWGDQSEELKETARVASMVPKEELKPSTVERIDAWDLHVRLVTMALAVGDDFEGGFGSQSRFPMAPQWTTLVERLQDHPDEKLQELVTLTLDQTVRQGLRDHIGGGFFRYTVDSSWQVPHYEKMLYNQALLVPLLIRAAEVLEKPEYLAVARETVDFTLEVMNGDRGGYISSLSAIDPFDVEGGGYLWTEQQLSETLTEEELVFAKLRWGMEGHPDTEGGFLPVDENSLAAMSKQSGQSMVSLVQLEQRVKAKLLAARTPRNHPRDDKQLASWNGLFLSALSDATEQFKQARYREAGSALRDYLVSELWDGEQLHRAKESGQSLGSAALEDYVFVAQGLYDWSSVGGKAEDVVLAKRLISEAWQRFYLQDGWRSSDKMLIPGLATEKVVNDGPLPSPPALLVDLTMKLGSEEEKALARKALVITYPIVREQPVWYAMHARTLINHAPEKIKKPKE